jgi:hypothetical protein
MRRVSVSKSMNESMKAINESQIVLRIRRKKKIFSWRVTSRFEIVFSILFLTLQSNNSFNFSIYL